MMAFLNGTSDVQPREDIKCPKSLWDFFCHEISVSLEERDFYKASDMIRNLLRQVDFECKKGSLSHECMLILKEKCLNKYASLVDDPSGINNYATEIETVAVTSNPQSAEWKSCFDNVSDRELFAMLPEDAVKPSEQDVIIKLGNVSESLMAQEKKCVINSLSFLEDIHISENFNEKNVWNTVSSLVKKSEFLWKEAFEKANGKCPGPINVGCTVGSSEHVQFNQNVNLTPVARGRNSSCPSLPTTSKSDIVRKPYVQNCNEFEQLAKRQKRSTDDSAPPADNPAANPGLQFQTARQMIGPVTIPQKQQNSNNKNKSLGLRRPVNSKFVPPVLDANPEVEDKEVNGSNMTDERLKNIDPAMVDIMLNEIMYQGTPLTWDEIAGLEFVKKTLKEIVVWPMLRPDIFTGLRGPPKGILLFGPPGTGKTLIGKCVASQSKSTFFSISASSLGSKWVGESEKLVRALFAVARCYQPAVIFIDEIDSLLTQRSNSEHESSRRLKTEFLVQLDGVKTSSDERLLVIGATNRPQELDEAARRRLVKRLYIPLPEPEARKQIVRTLLTSHSHQITEQDLDIICSKTDCYSGADMANLCKEASLGPIRSISFDEIAFIKSDEVRPIILDDFIEALKQVRASVSDTDLDMYEDWNRKYGSG